MLVKLTEMHRCLAKLTNICKCLKLAATSEPFSYYSHVIVGNYIKSY